MGFFEKTAFTWPPFLRQQNVAKALSGKLHPDLIIDLDNGAHIGTFSSASPPGYVWDVGLSQHIPIVVFKKRHGGRLSTYVLKRFNLPYARMGASDLVMESVYERIHLESDQMNIDKGTQQIIEDLKNENDELKGKGVARKTAMLITAGTSSLLVIGAMLSVLPRVVLGEQKSNRKCPDFQAIPDEYYAKYRQWGYTINRGCQLGRTMNDVCASCNYSVLPS